MSDLHVDENLDDILEHFGIKGMKWGVRRSDAQLARARGKRKKKGKPVTQSKITRKTISEDAAKARESMKKAKKGGAKALNDNELKELNKRLNLEQNYNRLTTSENGTIKSGHNFVKEGVDMGKTANEAFKLAKSPAMNEFKKQLKKKVSGG